MSKKLLYAHILVDRSGSMGVIREKTVNGINEYISGLAKDQDIDAAVSLSFFNGDHANGLKLDTLYNGVKASLIPPLTMDAYHPAGGTPLNDAIGKTAARMEAEWHRPGENVALVIMTDGEENASKEYVTKESVKTLLDRLQKENNWLVIYLGANQDSFQEGGSRGVMMANTMNFQAKNVDIAIAAAGRATRSYGLTGSASMAAFTDDERKASVDKT